MRQVFVDREQPRLRLFEGRAGVLLATTRAQRGDSVGEIERHFVEQGALFGVERRGAGRTDRQHTEDVRTLPERQQDAPQGRVRRGLAAAGEQLQDRKSTRLNSSHVKISYAVFCVK